MAAQQFDPKNKWEYLLNNIEGKDLWDDKRQERNEWKAWLDMALEATRKPRKDRNLDQGLVQRILRGQDIQNLDIGEVRIKTKVTVFVCSTFIDTKTERNAFIKDVYPYIRELCRTLNMEFGTVDMRWGICKQVVDDQGTLDMCLREVRRCLDTSAGPAFICLLTNRYGWRPIPPEIEFTEFERLTATLGAFGQQTDTLRRYYRLDTNSVPKKYLLIPDNQIPDKHAIVRDHKLIQRQLRAAASEVLGEPEKTKYFYSMTEAEVQMAIINNKNRQHQVILLDREVTKVTTYDHVNCPFVDVVNPYLDQDAQTCVRTLKERVRKLDLIDIVRLEYDEPKSETVSKYVKHACDELCLRLTSSILHTYETTVHVKPDEVLDEVIHHLDIARDRASTFVGREDLVRRIVDFVANPGKTNLHNATPDETHLNRATPGETNPSKAKRDRVFVVQGQSGCGKTALLAKVATELPKNFTIVLRFIGGTLLSSTSRKLVESMCSQICRIYCQEQRVCPAEQNLAAHFRKHMKLATKEQPLVIILDALDQLSNDDVERNLSWLSLKEPLPENVFIIVSTLPEGAINILKSYLDEFQDNFLKVQQLRTEEGREVLNQMLLKAKRQLTEDQRKVILASFQQCSLPLFLRVAADIAIRWHSFKDMDGYIIPKTVDALVNLVFDRLERTFSNILVKHSLAYMTAARSGLREDELEDILSCDDEVLEAIYEHFTPPVRRMPQMLWARIRSELDHYLTERKSQGVLTYRWYHRQFGDVAKTRYLGESAFERQTRQAIADYFQGKWVKGKPIGADGPTKDRQLPEQPIVLTGQWSEDTNRRNLNLRMLHELPYQLLMLKEWDQFKDVVCRLEFIEARFEAEQGYDCLAELQQATTMSKDKYINRWTKFVGANVAHIAKIPSAVYQMASQKVPGSIFKEQLKRAKKLAAEFAFLVDVSETYQQSPCKLTLVGHTGGVRCCSYSPDGTRIASTAEDGTLRVWDSSTGAQVFTINARGPTYPAIPAHFRGHRPCCYSRDGHRIVTGSENGWLEVWSEVGAQVCEQMIPFDSVKYKALGETEHAITSLSYSNDGSVLAVGTKCHGVYFYSDKDFKFLGLSMISGAAMGCAWSSDGKRLFVAMALYAYPENEPVEIEGGGLVVIDTTNNYKATETLDKYALCCAASPDNSHVVVAGCCGLALWDVKNIKMVKRIPAHTHYIWCVAYTSDGKALISCSSDRTVKIWDTLNWDCLCTMGGHCQRVHWVSIHPTADGANREFVTASFDGTLKTWDEAICLSGQLLPARGSHYHLLTISPDRKFMAVCKGWDKVCRFVDKKTGRVCYGMSTPHKFCIQNAHFTVDSKRLVTIDTGHNGAWTPESVMNAEAMVSSVPDGQHPVKLKCKAPRSVSCNKEHIIIATAVNWLIHVFSADTLQLVQDLNEFQIIPQDVKDTSLLTVACSPTTRHVAIRFGQHIKIWDYGNTFSDLPGADATDALVRRVMYSPDGRHLAVATDHGHVRLWSLEENGVVQGSRKSLVGHPTSVKDITFSPDWRSMGTVAADCSLCVWDVETAQLKASWYGPVTCMDFVDNELIVAGEATGGMRWLMIKPNNYFLQASTP